MCDYVFTADELRQRREKIFDTIGEDAIAVLQGADYPQAMSRFRQYNEFYYFTGIEVAHAYVVLDGRTRKTTLYLPHEAQISRDHDRPVPSVETADYAIELSGADTVRPAERLGEQLGRYATAYTFFKAGQGTNMTYGSANGWQNAVLADPWDGQQNRQARFMDTIRTRFPGVALRDLTPIVDRMRLVKSPREIDLCRRAGQLTARGVCDAIRATKPGVMEYQLDAIMQYHYVAGGAWGQGYPTIAASGANAWHGHYQVNDTAMKDGDLVLLDGAPDYRYYTSDIGRMWPVNGKYSQAQRELYGFVVEYHKVLLAAVRPGRTYADIQDEAAEIMRARIQGLTFSKPTHKAACETMCDFPWHMSHGVGMCVHDGSPRALPLEEGMVLSVDPQMRVPEQRLYMRCEDTIVVTADGHENFTIDAPLELDDVEKMMAEPGMLQAFPPLD